MNQHRKQQYTELLVIRSQQADKQAFELLVEMWQQPLWGYAIRYLEQDAEAWDAVQETWTAVIQGLTKLESPSQFVPWMFRILTNKCIDRLRKRKKQESLLERTVPPEHPPANSDNQELKAALLRLTDEQQTLITMRFSHGLETGQIAQIFGIADTTVRTRLHRTLNRLREILENKQ